MSEPLFNIVFYGIIQPDRDRDTALQNMATLFKTEPAKLAPYFEGGRKVIKAKVGELVAEKYRVALENIGLVIKIEEVADEPQAQKQSGAPSDSTETVQIDISGISLAEVGADIIEHPVEAAPQTIEDISDISMAEVGASVVEHPVEVTPQTIEDISDISMAEVGATVIEHPVEVTPQAIEDISDISMAEAGADIVENPKEKEKAPEPDISGLSLK